MALSLFNEMPSKGVKHITENYNTILDGLYRAGRVVDAEKIRNGLNFAGCP